MSWSFSVYRFPLSGAHAYPEVWLCLTNTEGKERGRWDLCSPDLTLQYVSLDLGLHLNFFLFVMFIDLVSLLSQYGKQGMPCLPVPPMQTLPKAAVAGGCLQGMSPP